MRVSVQFEPTLDLFNGFSAAKTFEISSNGEISDGVISEISALEAELVDGYTVKDNIIEIFMEVGNGNAKFSFSTFVEGSTNWLKTSMATCGSMRIDAYTSSEFSFIFSVAVSDDNSNPELEQIQVEDVVAYLEEERDSILLAAKIAYLLPDKEVIQEYGKALVEAGTIATIIFGICYFMVCLIGSIILL